MRLDLDFVMQLCGHVGLPSVRSGEIVDVDLGRGVFLQFQNTDLDEDCLVGFLDAQWHTHNGLTFVDPRGNYVEIDFLDIPEGLKDGSLLVCEHRKDGKLLKRWLIHRDYNDEFDYLGANEEIVVWRAITQSSSDTQ